MISEPATYLVKALEVGEGYTIEKEGCSLITVTTNTQVTSAVKSRLSEQRKLEGKKGTKEGVGRIGAKG